MGDDKEVKVERSRWKSTEGAYEVNRGEETAEEGSELLMRRKRIKGNDAKVRSLEKQIGIELRLDPGK